MIQRLNHLNLEQEAVKIGINGESEGRYDKSDIIFKAPLVRSNLFDYSESTYLLKGLQQFQTLQAQQ